MYVNFRDKKAALDIIPDGALLEIGIPEVQFYNIQGSYQALCPFHGDTHLGNFGYNPHKRVWKCFVCGKSGRDPYSLIGAVKNWGFKQTIDYLYEHRTMATLGFPDRAPASILSPRAGKIKSVNHFYSSRNTGFSVGSPVIREMPKQDIPPTSREKHLIYQEFAKLSPLTERQKSALCKKRGLYYRSTQDFFRFPSPADPSFIETLLERLERPSPDAEADLSERLLGVPGFFWNQQRGQYAFVGYQDAVGILNHDADGLINGIELRLPDGAANGTRYIPFSSESVCFRYPDRFVGGTSLGAIVDVVYPTFEGKDSAGIAVTEGKFKALHLAYKGYTVLNIHGISNWRNIFPVLEKLAGKGVDTGRVCVVFDADSRTNPPVAEASRSLGTALMEAGYEVSYLTWPLSCGKGFDDLDNGGNAHRARTVPAQKFIDTTLAPFLERAKKRRGKNTALA